jgi:hypothetical protein
MENSDRTVLRPNAQTAALTFVIPAIAADRQLRQKAG